MYRTVRELIWCWDDLSLRPPLALVVQHNSYSPIKTLVRSFVCHESDVFSIALPTIQAVFSIPVRKNGSNHTPQFAESARAIEAHEATITTSKALAATALRILVDDEFYSKVVRTRTQASIPTDWVFLSDWPFIRRKCSRFVVSLMLW